MKKTLAGSAKRIGKLLLASLIGITAVTAIGSNAGALTFSVAQSQWNLAGLGYLPYSGIDGRTGPNTAAATRAFQKNRCLSVDGIIGNNTTNELAALMKAVQAKIGTAQDGMNGPNTKSKLQAWQKRNGLNADGQAGPNTLSKMGIAYTKKCPTPTNGCAAGTKDLGVHETWVSGRSTSTRLCAIPGFRSKGDESRSSSKYYVRGSDGNVIVSAKASGQALKMFKAAKSAGVTLVAGSSFRTMANQKAICKAEYYCSIGYYGRVAKPGYSNHQSGNAIDVEIGNNSGFVSGATCSNGKRSVGYSSREWNWLRGNAHKYGYRQLATEAWHWEFASASWQQC